MAMTPQQTRRENLRRLINNDYEGNRSAFSRATGVHQNQINLVLTDNEQHQRNLGEFLAKKIEAALGLAPGYLDQSLVENTEGAFQVECLPASPNSDLSHVFAQDSKLLRFFGRNALAAQLEGRITGVSNLATASISVSSMEPEVMRGDNVLLDVGVKAVTDDGVYAFKSEGHVYLRRFKKLLAGGWDVSDGSGKVNVLESLKGITILARVVLIRKLQYL